MTTASRLTPALILRELAKMSVSEMDAVLYKLQRLAAVKKGALKTNEAALLESINLTLPPDQRAAYRRLSARRKSGSLNPAEHRELVRLSDALETLHAQRLQSIVALASLREISVPELVESLGLESLASHG